VPVRGYHLLSYEDADLQTHVLALVLVDPSPNPVVERLLRSTSRSKIVCYWSLQLDQFVTQVSARLTAVVEGEEASGAFELEFKLPRDRDLFRVVAEQGRMVLATSGPEEIDGELRAPLPHVSFSLSGPATADALEFATKLLDGAGRQATH